MPCQWATAYWPHILFIFLLSSPTTRAQFYYCLRVFFLNESSNTFDVSHAKTLKPILRGRKLPTGRILKNCFYFQVLESTTVALVTVTISQRGRL